MKFSVLAKKIQHAMLYTCRLQDLYSTEQNLKTPKENALTLIIHVYIIKTWSNSFQFMHKLYKN